MIRITDLLANDGYILCNKALLHEFGINETLLLGELAQEYNYWDNRSQLENGWFYSTVENVENATTLSAYQQREALRTLIDRNIVSVEKRGLPPKRYIKLNLQAILGIFDLKSKES